MIDMLIRWRTWVVNLLAAFILILPDLLQAFSGFDWGVIVPPRYMPLVTVGLVLVNIWMRPRPAVRARDPEASMRRPARDDDNDWDFQ